MSIPRSGRRVLLANMPRLLRETLEEVLRETRDLDVVCLPDSEPLEVGLEAHRPDVLVAHYDTDEPTLHAELLRSFPHLRVLALTSQGQRQVAYMLRPARVELGELPFPKLRDLIRGAGWEVLPWPT